ncbi:vinexin-like isoform X5 [Argiope bruennichi]|uniref:vinexin-like isoform X5 n=1 Tax=Argiope bruennichi TaxID=94029 RepID=UPI0024944039|nr:vinexin-like isoform X5 [Argiope bruennichi]
MSGGGCFACIVSSRSKDSKRKVNSKGREQGLKEGDRVLSVNGQPTAEMTHADAQRVIRESSSGIELQIERNTANSETNGFCTTQNGSMADGEIVETRLNALDEEVNHAGSWSTDSTSTGSTTIHVSSLNSDDTSASEGVWSPSTKRANLRLNCNLQPQNEMPAQIQPESPPKATNTKESKTEDEKSPVWQPFGAPYEGPPQFRPVKLGLSQTKTTTTTTTLSHNEVSKDKETEPTEVTKPESPSPSCTEKERTTSPTAGKPLSDSPLEPPSTSTAPTIFTKTGWGSHLPPSQSPTITLLQKAREGKITKGAVHIEEKPESTPIPRNAVLIDQKVTVEGDKVHTDSYYAVPTLTTESTTHNIKAPPKYDGIGPTEYGIPVGLRTGVKEEYASDWYKTMYKSLHRSRFPNEPTKTVHLGGYMSEPEYERKDKIKSKYATDYRRKPEKSVSYTTDTSSDLSRINADSNVVRHDTKEVYRVEPRSIAEYEPGKSSLAEKEFQKFWSDFWDSMDDLHEHLGSSPRSPRPQQGLNRRWPNVLLSDGYDSDSTLIRKTGRIPEVDPDQQKAWYKEIQKGGEIPLTGLRKSAPERPAAPTHKYEETEVNIHYRSPVRHLEKEYIDEEELRKIQEDAMRKLYEEERRKKHQQELAEIEMRRHSDFFTPSQKSPIPLNRYDNPFESNYHNLAPHGFSRGPPPKTMARALYPFTAQTTRELSLNKGDIVYITKQVDKNWYEGEHHGLVGIFPVTYVEIIPNEKANLQPRKAVEGEALVKYNFRAQTPQELSLFKGEKVVLIRRLDHNWFEGRLGAKKGIFPISYVEVLQEPGEFSGTRTASPKPPASPVFSSLISGSPPKTHEGPTFNTGLRPLQSKPPLQLEKSEARSPLTQSLHIDTYNEPIPYRALYAYKPQNDDELELKEGDTVYVMEKCDDGWYVGTSLRTGLFGTFPGNYVERI